MQTDHTAEIFTALNITPTAHPWAYKVIYESETWNLENFLKFYSMDDADYYPYELLSGTIEADGLAVSLWGILVDKGLQPTDDRWTKFLDYGYGVSFAQLVHDALCEALGIAEGEVTQ